MSPLAILALVAGLAALPADISGRMSGPDYNAFLQRSAVADHVRTTGVACNSPTLRWLGRDRIGGDHIPPEVSRASVTHDVVIEHVQVSGCGRSQRHNLMVYRQANNQLTATALPTGASQATPTLQRDSFSAAVRIAVGMSRDAVCPAGRTLAENFRFGDITLERPRRGNGPWAERMPIQYCGLNRTVVVTYTPSPNGGTDWDIRPAWPGAPRVR